MARIVKNPISLSVTVCAFEFVFKTREEAMVYLMWFENYAKQHRRQTVIAQSTRKTSGAFIQNEKPQKGN
jgi:hypothetical protein